MDEAESSGMALASNSVEEAQGQHKEHDGNEKKWRKMTNSLDADNADSSARSILPPPPPR